MQYFGPEADDDNDPEVRICGPDDDVPPTE